MCAREVGGQIAHEVPKVGEQFRPLLYNLGVLADLAFGLLDNASDLS